MGVELSRIWRAPHASVTQQFGRFVIVGLSNTAVSFVIYIGLLGLGVTYWLSGGIGFAGGVINGYLLNRRWTFASPDSSRARIRYVLVQLAGLVAAAGLLWVFVALVPIGRLLAYAVVIPVVTAATFLANRNWTFSTAS